MKPQVFFIDYIIQPNKYDIVEDVIPIMRSGFTKMKYYLAVIEKVAAIAHNLTSLVETVYLVVALSWYTLGSLSVIFGVLQAP